MAAPPDPVLPDSADAFLRHVAASLGRRQVLSTLPVPPPAIDERFARLVAADADLVAVFAERATAAKMRVHHVDDAVLAGAVVEHLRAAGHRSAVVTRCDRFERVGLLDAIRAAEIDARYWDESTLDAAYDVDVGITDVWAAVAETGSVVVRSSAAHGRAASLVPPHHVAVVGREQIVADLIDLMARVTREGTGAGLVAITGPSKTADIEMNLVVGVHGPGTVEIFVV